MTQTMQAIDLRNLDKSSWQTYRFDQIARSITERVDPNNTDLEVYIGLEHIDSDSIHIKRTGTPDDVNGQKLRCYPGDVIFGRRRAYQRKAAIATVDAFCSAHSLILRANPDVIDPKLFPFFLHSDSFMHRAIDISVGSLSPTINWGTLKHQEFQLPLKDQQARLAELLWAMDEVLEKDLTTMDKLSLALDSDIENKIHGVNLTGHTIQQVIDNLSKIKNVGTLTDFGKIFKGKGISKSEIVDKGHPCVRYGELYTKHHRLIRKFHSFITDESAANSIKLKKSDVLFAGSGETIAEIGKSAAFIGDEDVYAGGDILIFRPYDMDGTYLGYLLNSQLVRQQLNKYGTGATVMHIYASDIEKIKIPIIKKEEQVKIGQHLESITDNISMLKIKISSSKSLQKSLINQIF
jgi:type I restriction enzyme, S subunit